MLELLAPFADLAFLLVQSMFVMNLIPTVRQQFQAKACTVPMVTSSTTFFGLLILAVFQLALGLQFAAISATVSAFLWATIAWQRFHYGG